MKYIILHSVHDKYSREFVASLPEDNNEYEVIDWYQDEGARFSYIGPPVSAFPSVAFESDSVFYIIRRPNSWKEVDEAVAASLTQTKYAKLSSVDKGKFIGGQRIEELDSLVKSYPHYFNDSAAVVTKLETVMGRKNVRKI